MVLETIQIPPQRPNLLYHAVATPDTLQAHLRRVSKMEDREKVAFTREIPDWALDQPARLDRILGGKAHLLLTPTEDKVLHAKAPWLVDGRAGSGKTMVLCSRFAGRDDPSVWPRGRQVFLSYSNKLVRMANSWTEEIFINLLPERRMFSGEFLTLYDFLLAHVPPSARGRFGEDRLVGFGAFKKWYNGYAKGRVETRKMPAETVWHGIRSTLKGSCEPPARPFPDTGEDEFEKRFYAIAKKRRDLPPDDLETIFGIGKKYQEQLVVGENRWDDQDLAWEALNWIRKQKRESSGFVGYDGIFCDEVQDLTRIEFLALAELCKEPVGDESLQLFLAGDPLQTINPSGFNWQAVRSEVFKVQKGRAVEPVALGENFRTDKRILPLANLIDKIRFELTGQPGASQVGFDQGGSVPLVIEEPVPRGNRLDAKSERILAAIRTRLSKLGPESPVIVWPEDVDDVKALKKGSETLKVVDDASLDTLSQAKGLEFDRVYLYGFGSSEEAARWKSHISVQSPKEHQERRLDEKTTIPFLYFLNRLYVAVTRARRFLVIIDTKEGIDNLWRPLAQHG